MVDATKPDASEARTMLDIRGLSVRAGSRTLLQDIDLEIPQRRVFGIIGPSGAGKSALLRCLNRLIDLDTGLRVSGDIELDGQSIFAPDVDVDTLRARVGILFQQPAVFPQSIEKNVLFGARHVRRLDRVAAANLAERALRDAALWDEVKDRLAAPAITLSVGQQQRLCLARALALDPEVLLMDEPTSALDAHATEAIEKLILRLAPRCTIVLVTHDIDQARRVTDRLACLGLREGIGRLVECGPRCELLDGKTNSDIAERLGGSDCGA